MNLVFTWLVSCLSLVLITAPLGAQQTASELANVPTMWMAISASSIP